MAGLNEDTESADVSAEDTLDGGVSTEVETRDDAAGSSPEAPAGGETGGIMSVIRNVTDESAAKATSPVDETRDHQEAAAPKDAGANDDSWEENHPLNKNPRFRQVIAERNELRKKAERVDALETYLVDNAMTSDEAATAISLFALRKRDPEAFWKELRPVVQEVLVQIGEVLPQDLRQQVQTGQITADTAKMLAKERAKAGKLEGQMSFAQQQAERRAAAQAQQQAVQAQREIRGAVQTWEAETSQKDPDFARKLDALQKEVTWLQRSEGVPDTAQGVRAQLQKAYRTVNASLQQQRPRKPEVRPLTGGSTSANPRGKPGSIMEIIERRGAV